MLAAQTATLVLRSAAAWALSVTSYLTHEGKLRPRPADRVDGPVAAIPPPGGRRWPPRRPRCGRDPVHPGLQILPHPRHRLPRGHRTNAWSPPSRRKSRPTTTTPAGSSEPLSTSPLVTLQNRCSPLLVAQLCHPCPPLVQGGGRRRTPTPGSCPRAGGDGRRLSRECYARRRVRRKASAIWSSASSVAIAGQDGSP